MQDFAYMWNFLRLVCFFFFFNDTATTEIYTLSLHDALPICMAYAVLRAVARRLREDGRLDQSRDPNLPEQLFQFSDFLRSEEHTSELQSRQYLVCRLLLEKKNQTKTMCIPTLSTIKPNSILS